MASSLGKFKSLGVVLFCISVFMGNANATPTDDLVAAVSKADLEGMQKTLQQGGDPNVLVCANWYEGYIYPANHEKCARVELSYPLIWGVERYFRFSPEVALSMEELLAKAGAKSTVYSVNQVTGVTVNASDEERLLENIFFMSTKGDEKKVRQVKAERAMAFVRAGFIPSENQLKNVLSRMQLEIHMGREGGSICEGARNFLAAIEATDFSSERCKITFQKAATIEGFQKFIDKFQANDSCNLVPQAKEKLAVLAAQEKQRKIQEEKERAAKAKTDAAAEVERLRLEAIREKAEAAAEKNRIKAEAVQQAKERKQIAAFRKSVAEGDETNCGLAIEVKGKLVKIAFAVANYGNEHWIRRDQIFPSGYGCRFMNGQYQMPE